MKQTKNSIYGAFIGDYYGSYWEFLLDKPIDLEDSLDLRKGKCSYTDDTLMTIAIASAVLKSKQTIGLSENAVKEMQHFGNSFRASYGCAFSKWLKEPNPRPYNSWGNGASMRVSPVGLSAKSLQDAKNKANLVTMVTHNHPYALIWARIVSELIFLAKKQDATKEQLKEYLFKNHRKESEIIFGRLNGIETLHVWYSFNEASQTTCPQAIRCFFESDSFADCLAKSLYVGGDSDTLSAISCSIAAPFYGDEQVNPFIKKLPKLALPLARVVEEFQNKYH